MSFMNKTVSHAGEPLSDEAIRAVAPSVFADAAHESRSQRYTYISTASVVTALRKEGFEPVFARQARTRDEGRYDFTKHLIRFRHPSMADLCVNDTFPEVVLLNSHDGTSSYQVMAGMFRLLCLNGLVVSEGGCETVRVPHKGNVLDQVIEGSYRVLEHSAKALCAANEWQRIELNRDERVAFAESAHILRFADAEGNVTTPTRPEQLLKPRRSADAGNSLWLTYNRVEEAVIKGGVTGYDRRTGRRTTTRAINSIDGDVRLNKALHHLADRMAALKAA
jgi:hypothetical protein